MKPHFITSNRDGTFTTAVLIDDCDCDSRAELAVFEYDVFRFEKIEQGVAAVLELRRSGAMYWAVHVGDKHLAVNPRFEF